MLVEAGADVVGFSALTRDKVSTGLFIVFIISAIGSLRGSGAPLRKFSEFPFSLLSSRVIFEQYSISYDRPD